MLIKEAKQHKFIHRIWQKSESKILCRAYLTWVIWKILSFSEQKARKTLTSLSETGLRDPACFKAVSGANYELCNLGACSIHSNESKFMLQFISK